MTVANKVRGEFPIELRDGDSLIPYVLRCDFEAYEAIDEQLGSIIDVAARVVSQGSLSAKEMAVIVTEGMKAQGRKTGNAAAQAYTAKKVSQMIFQTGTHACLKPVAEFLIAAMSGGVLREGNAEAGAVTPTA